MTTLYKVDGTGAGGIYFNKPDGTLGATTVSSIQLSGVTAGEKIIVNGATTVSCLANSSVPYYGFHFNSFSASQLLLTRTPQGHWFDWANSVPISPQSGWDLHDGSQTNYGVMDPYLNHDQTAMHEFTSTQQGDWYLNFVVWASSANATGDSVAKNEYLWIVPQQTSLQAMRFPN
ncbi:hypothetical protein [Microvirga rosea]|uniref:hypothetical protein n=1 Tax=Microvirga rosea TaxID=2715425 RepID=UPI001D0AD0AA|nr:hypothetical protein [Microvirga rosea]MCB8820067.1 hypothetical protein [Microvirga rosea]